MKKALLKALSVFAAGLISAAGAFAQTPFEGIVTIDKTVHDWGDVTVSDGPLDCTFTLTNISKETVIIRAVASSCGCTGVKWTQGPIAPGEQANIWATYANDEGPYAFDKTLTVTFVGVRKPLILHLRGVVHPKKMPLKDTYPVHFGQLGFRESKIKVGNLSQGEQKSIQVRIANIGKKPITVSFESDSPFLTFKPAKFRLRGNSTTMLGVTVTADRTLWGRNVYNATPVVNGVLQKESISFVATTRENFDFWGTMERAVAPEAEYEGAFAADPVEPGTPVTASFKIANKGKTALNIYKMDFNSDNIAVKSSVSSIKAGGQSVFKFTYDTTGMKPDGDNLGIITLYTNDPQHSVIHLYIDVIIL
ncbi:MAG: DUF1573 domain-containing protein [Bacteroidales bacterium]|nr:DUF1573 domain-containing protein [Bacteroidales bacterium]